MAVNWKALARDKRVWAAAAVAAGAAVVVAVRRRSGGGDAPVGSGANPAAPPGYYQAVGDTTGTDLSGFLSNWFQASSQAQSAGFQSILDALKNNGVDGGQNPETASFEHGNHLLTWLADINAAYPGLGLTEAKFRQLNPGVSIQTADAFGFTNTPRAGGGQLIPVFAGASGTVKIR